MAKGTMQYETTSLNAQVEILNRPPFEAVSMTLDFTTSDTDEKTGKKMLKAGTVISKDGTKISTPWTDVAGILLFDVYEDRPQGTLLKKAYINRTVAEKHATVTYDATLATALPMIVFEPAIV